MTSGAEMVSLNVDQAEEPLSKPTIVRSVRKNYLIGIALLLVVVLLWTSSNFITQDLFEGGYHKPFLVTYFNTSSFTFYLLPLLIRYLWRRYKDEDDTRQARGQYETLPTSEHDILENPPLLHSSRVPHLPVTDDSHHNDTECPTQLAPLTTKETVYLASVFCFFWFIANWSVNAALDYTSVASTTILSSTSGFFTLLIGRVFRVESLTSAKIVAVVASFIGVLLVSLSDSSSPTPTTLDPITSVTTVIQTHVYTTALIGDILAVLAAVFYALYVILLKVRIHSESRIDMQLFFGFVGLFNILAMFPVGVILNFTGHEPFELPSSGKSWGAVLVNMAITLSSDYIYVIAMLKTTPIVVTIGLSLTIPLAVVGDEILHKPTALQAGLGALFVIGGFVLVGWEDGKAQKLDDQLDVRTVVDTSRHVSPDGNEARDIN